MTIDDHIFSHAAAWKLCLPWQICFCIFKRIFFIFPAVKTEYRSLSPQQQFVTLGPYIHASVLDLTPDQFQLIPRERHFFPYTDCVLFPYSDPTDIKGPSLQT